MTRNSRALSRSWLFDPVLLTGVFLLLVMVFVAAGAGGDPLVFAQLGTRYSLGDPAGSQGYDGQFVYYIAVEPDPLKVSEKLDAPAYRYQRILLPLTARLLGFANPAWIAWMLPLIGILAHCAGTWAVAELLAGWGVRRRYALVYGLWAGFVLAVRLDLPEPLAYGLVCLGLLAGERSRPWLRAFLFMLALFAKEVVFPFLVAQLLVDLAYRRWKDVAGLLLVAFLPYAVFQGVLWLTFGQPGLGSGGEMATGFELIPFMGLFRIGAYSPVYLAGMLVVFGPLVILPALWGGWAAIQHLRRKQWDPLALNLLLHTVLIATMPFSTFRETGGLIRFASGLVLAVLLFAARHRYARVLNYSFIWIVLNVFILKT